MGRSFAGAGEDALAFLAGNPTGPKQRRVWMGRAFQNPDATADLTDAFSQQRNNRRAFFHARRKLVRVASKTNRPLSGNEKLDELRMAAVKLHLVRGDTLYQIDGLVVAPIFRFCQTQ